MNPEADGETRRKEYIFERGTRERNTLRLVSTYFAILLILNLDITRITNYYSKRDVTINGYLFDL